MFDRYAVFYTPPAGPLASFGASWLGWDPARGQRVAHHDIAGLDIASLTATPRKYGLHGTLKPPFFLASGRTQAQLEDAIAGLAGRLSRVRVSPIMLETISGFIALRPAQDAAGIDDLGMLAGQIVRDLDAFRAPPSEAELVRRRERQLSPRQTRYLADWGYPYVMEEFRFHLTLTGRLDAPLLNEVRAALLPLIEPMTEAPLEIDSITLLGQDSDGMFHEIHRYALTG